MERTTNRIFFLDYLRGFMILLVVLDHSMHAYSERYGDFFFFKDFDRSTFIDVLHLHNDAIMMPFMFFLAGIFVFPSLNRRGYASYLKERFLKLVVPFILGILFITPFMVHHKKIVNDEITAPFFDFWYNYYIRWQDIPFGNLSQGGFWFLYLLFILTASVLLINFIFPSFVRFLGHFVRWCANYPIRGLIILGIIFSLILGFSDLKWGAPWWIGYKPVFHVRGSRFIAKIIFFLLGIGFAQSGLLQDNAFLHRLAESWKKWTAGAFVILATYIIYTLVFFDEGVYGNDFRHYITYEDGKWFDEKFWTIVRTELPWVLTRTTLLACTMVSLSGMYLSIFKKFLDKPHDMWKSLAASSFGIYIFHEPITTATQLYLYGMALNPILKFMIVSALSLGISWFIVAKVLLHLPGFRRIL